jgi:outer membrane protein TolC
VERFVVQIRQLIAASAIASALLLSGCMLTPKGTEEHVAEMKQQGQAYEKPFEQRQLPEIPEPAAWQDVLHRAFLANGELEASYHEWRAAAERIRIASYWPNSNLQLGFSYTFSPESMKTWDRVTASAAFDPSVPLKLPGKVEQGGRVALADAQQTARAFAATKFRIQRQVMEAYYDLALMEEKIRIQQQNATLLQSLVDDARARVVGGGAQQDLLKAQVQARMNENELATMQADAARMRAMLNGMMDRKPEAELVLAGELPAARPIPLTDDQLVAMGVDASPEVARLAAQVKGRSDAIELAKMQYLPDISPTASFTGSVSQSLGAMVMLPTTTPMINASIREAKAMRDASDAMLRQTRSDRTANFVATLYALRNAERQKQFLEERIFPAARQVLASSRQDYVVGKVPMADLVESQRMLLELRRSIAQLSVDREKRLAELEELAGMDIEAMKSHSTTRATTQAP